MKQIILLLTIFYFPLHSLFAQDMRKKKSCDSNLTVTHTAGSVAPVSKTISYVTVYTKLSGTYKCWLGQNLGSDHQPASASDATEASAGWYWQFNHKQGYKFDNNKRTPTTSWESSFNENSDWTRENDPCNLLLGSGWRIPTSTEYENADKTGNWNNADNAFNSALRLHNAGYLNYSDGLLLNRGIRGTYRCSNMENTTTAHYLRFSSTYSYMNTDTKAFGFPLRCIKD